MQYYVTGETIKKLREKKGLTQAKLGEVIGVSDKTISKWECAKGLPDITLIEPLAQALSVSIAELFAGKMITNNNRGSNMMRSHFYVCPVCGNIIFSTGEAMISCCGITLPPLEAEALDEAHKVSVTRIEDEQYVQADHPMTKEHFISFIAWVDGGKAEIMKCYPESEAAVRFKQRGSGILYLYCNQHGLFHYKMKRSSAMH